MKNGTHSSKGLKNWDGGSNLILVHEREHEREIIFKMRPKLQKFSRSGPGFSSVSIMPELRTKVECIWMIM